MTPVNLSYLNIWTWRGRRYCYFRRPGHKSIRLPPPNPCFHAAYQAALAATDTLEIGADRTKPGSVNAAVVSYYASKSTFQTLAPATQMLRRVYLEKLRERYGDNSIASMQPEFVAKMIDRMSPATARNWLKAIRGLMRHVIAIGLCKTDPTIGVKLPKVGGSIHTWTASRFVLFIACRASRAWSTARV